MYFLDQVLNYSRLLLPGLSSLRRDPLWVSPTLSQELPQASRKVSELLDNEGVFFELNYDNRHVGGTNAKEFLPHYLKASVDLGQSFNRGHGQLWASDPAGFTKSRRSGVLSPTVVAEQLEPK